MLSFTDWLPTNTAYKNASFLSISYTTYKQYKLPFPGNQSDTNSYCTNIDHISTLNQMSPTQAKLLLHRRGGEEFCQSPWILKQKWTHFKLDDRSIVSGQEAEVCHVWVWSHLYLNKDTMLIFLHLHCEGKFLRISLFLLFTTPPEIPPQGFVHFIAFFLQSFHLNTASRVMSTVPHRLEE